MTIVRALASALALFALLAPAQAAEPGLAEVAALAPADAPTATQAPRDEFSTIFAAANQDYLNGRYEQAVTGYRKLVEAGLVHPDLYFNLANACYRAGEVGLAVLFFEKALAVDPADEAARSNLEAVRKELIDRVVMSGGDTVGEPLWHGFIRGLQLGWLTWSFIALHLLFFGLLILRRVWAQGPVKRLIFWINVPLLTVLLVLGLLLFSRIYVEERVHHAVVVSKVAALREGPQKAAKVSMEVHAGLKVRVLNEVGDFVRVRLANGVEGFVLSPRIGRI